MQEHPYKIPIDKNIFVLSEFLKCNQDDVEVYVVGGAVRDFLLHKFHGNRNEEFVPKDYDITTNLSEDEILERLQTPLAKKARIKVKEKTSVDTFGVVFVYFRGKNYEVAPFRKDIGGDGRRPEATERGTLLEDAMRRDFTINNLYYDFEKEVILDLNPNNYGIVDIVKKRIRCVGNPMQRFSEDKLRVLRMVRFFSRFNESDIRDSLDEEHIQAIETYKDIETLSYERIQAEFILGVQQSKHTYSYVMNLYNLGLLNRMFPNLKIDIESGVRKDFIQNHKSVAGVLAWILRLNTGVYDSLNKLKYPSSISRSVSFLIDAYFSNPQQMAKCIKERERLRHIGDFKEDLLFLSRSTNEYSKYLHLKYFSEYLGYEINPYILMDKGFNGPDLGKEIDRLTSEYYKNDFNEYIDTHLNTIPN